MENNNDNIIMSRLAFERMQSKDERNDRWRNIIIILLIILLAATNGAWLWAWNQYEYEEETTTVEMDTGEGGDNNYIGHNGDINNGTDESNNQKKNKTQEKMINIDDISNSEIEHAIDEWIHSERDRKILKRRLIDGICYEPLADEMDMSVRQIKNIVSKAEAKLFRHL